MHKDDVDKHICKAANIPLKGSEKLPTTTEASI